MRSLLRALAGALILCACALVPARATITSTSTKTTAACNGATTSFSFSFVGVSAADIVVTVTTSTGVATVLTSGTQYTLTLNPPAANAIWGLGGSVLYPLSGSPCPTGSTITIARSVPYTQTTPFANQGPFLPQATESVVDLLTMQAQQLNTLFSGALVQPTVDSQSLSALPPAAQRANQALCFDSTGYVPTGCGIPASGTISSAMQPVVSAGSLAAGRTAFGLGAMATEGIGAGLQDNGSGSARVNFTSTQVSTNQAIGSANHLTQYIATGPITFTLARSNTLWNGFGFWINAFTGAITLTPNASDNFVLSSGALSSGTSTTIFQGQQAFVFTDGATTGAWYVQFTGGSFTTGDVKATLKSSADPGWVLLNDGTIGNAGSGATTRANADCFALFSLLWNNVSNTYAPVSGGRGASALADWNALKTIQLLSVAGRALAGAGTGSGLTARALGQNLGEETHTLAAGELPHHTHAQIASNLGGSGFPLPGGGSPGSASAATDNCAACTDTPFNQMQPTVFVNWMIHL